MNEIKSIYKIDDVYRKYDKTDYITLFHYSKKIDKIRKNALLKDMIDLPDKSKTPFWIKISDNNEIKIYTNSKLINLYDFIHNKIDLLSFSQIIKTPNEFIESVIDNKYILNQKVTHKLLLQKYNKKINNICVLFGDFIPYMKEISKRYDMCVYLKNEKVLDLITKKVDLVDVYIYDKHIGNDIKNNTILNIIKTDKDLINSVNVLKTRTTEYDSLKKSVYNFTEYTNLSLKLSSYSKPKYLHENIAMIENIR